MIQLRVLSGTCVLELRFLAERLLVGDSLAENSVSCNVLATDIVELSCGQVWHLEERSHWRPEQGERQQQWCREVKQLLSSQNY